MGLECEVVVREPADDGVADDLARVLREAGASRVVPLLVGEPEPEQRAAELVNDVMVAVTFSGTVVTIIDVVRRWLSERSWRGDGDLSDGPRSVKIVVGAGRDRDSIEIINPSTEAEQRLIDLFIERHS
ncbi:hypothetical protein [Streptomyces sp. TS71-3]|uniref:hypothetical protein n=1 Tax=Streptomyces sp. TS71-3 TaxID=2733862 RepID=UPI001BB412A5|nr:hypothetical protein [Streptomyces sp. TS71-3]